MRSRGRAHVHLNRFLSLSIPLDEIVDGTRAVGRAVKRAFAKKPLTRVAEIVGPAEQAVRASDEAEATLVRMGFSKTQARKAIEKVDERADSAEIVKRALRSMK
jgi:hypothetical protein